jgi:hypothetical protein
MVQDPAVVRERDPDNTELRRHLEDVVAEEALLLISRKVGIEVVEAEPGRQLWQSYLGDVDGRGGIGCRVDMRVGQRTMMIVIGAGLT